MQLNISQEQIDKATEEAIAKLLSPNEYSNLVKKILEAEFNYDYNGNPKTEFGKQFKAKVLESMSKLMDLPDFHTQLGAVIIDKFAEACVKDIRTLKEKKKININKDIITLIQLQI
jgi:hypothetical protein